MTTISATPQPLTAGRSLPVLVSELERAQWGPLAGARQRVARVLLGVLAGALNQHRGIGKMTVRQLAGMSGYSARWTAQGLRDLEHLGLLEWDRGHVLRGKAVPSTFRLDKQLLADVVNVARGLRREAERRAAAEFRERLARLRAHTLRPHRRNRRSVHVEVGSTLPLTGRDNAPPAAPVGDAVKGAASVRAALAAAIGHRRRD